MIMLEETIDGKVTLCCPSCGSNYLHHGLVRVYARPTGETGETTISMVKKDGAVKEPVESTENPSEKRGAIRITFWCEICNSYPELDIIQHKGNTFVQWNTE